MLLPGRVPMLLPAASLMAGGGAQGCVDFLVLPAPWCAYPQAAAGCIASAVCPCDKHIIDVHGDHIHTCKKHTGSRKDAHETILTALEQICHDSGLSTRRSNIPSVDRSNGKPGRGDLVVKDS